MYYISFFKLVSASQCSLPCPLNLLWDQVSNQCTQSCDDSKKSFYSNSSCLTCKNYIHLQNCVQNCPVDSILIKEFCVPLVCKFYDFKKASCVQHCSHCQIIDKRTVIATCIERCDQYKIRKDSQVYCVGVCPTGFRVKDEFCLQIQSYDRTTLIILCVSITSLLLIFILLNYCSSNSTCLIYSLYLLWLFNSIHMYRGRHSDTHLFINQSNSNIVNNSQSRNECLICFQQNGSVLYRCRYCDMTSHFDCIIITLRQNASLAVCASCNQSIIIC